MGIVDEGMAFVINIGMEKLGGHLLQFGYLTCHVAAIRWLNEDEERRVWDEGRGYGRNVTFNFGNYL